MGDGVELRICVRIEWGVPPRNQALEALEIPPNPSLKATLNHQSQCGRQHPWLTQPPLHPPPLIAPALHSIQASWARSCRSPGKCCRRFLAERALQGTGTPGGLTPLQDQDLTSPTGPKYKDVLIAHMGLSLLKGYKKKQKGHKPFRGF